MQDNNEKIVDLIIRTSAITSQVLKSALQDFLNNKSKSKGKIRFGDLAVRSDGKLESIEVTQNNIGDFKAVAMKYNIDYSLKRDKSSNPPLYHVFFATKNADNFKKAFSEYVSTVDKKHIKENLTITREQIKNRAVQVGERSEPDKQKVRTKQKQVTR